VTSFSLNGKNKFLNRQFALMLSLDDVFMIIVIAFQVALLSTLLAVFYKKLGKIMQMNSTYHDVLIDRINEIQVMVTDLSALVLKKDIKQEKSDPNEDAMPMDTTHLFETHREHPVNANEKDSNDNMGNLHSSLGHPLASFSRSLSSIQSLSPQPHSHSPSDQVEKNKINKTVELKNDLEYFKNRKDDIYTSEKPEFDNGSANELKSLESEILFALQRLEKTKPNLDEEQEKQDQK
jgi:hypothetical protein